MSARALAPTSVPATNTGWYDATGFHDGLNTNYATGSTGLAAFHGGRVRSFFVFDMSGVSGNVVSAEFSARSYGGDGVSDTFTLYDVSTPAGTLAATATGATQIFDDLGSGTILGAAMVPDPAAPTVTVPLSGAGVAALQTALGDTFEVGGDYAPGVTTSQHIFDATGGGNGGGTTHPLSDVQLVVTLAPLSTTTTTMSTTTTVVSPTTTAPPTTTTPPTTMAAIEGGRPSTTVARESGSAPTGSDPAAVSIASSPGSGNRSAGRGALPATGRSHDKAVSLGVILVLAGFLLVRWKPASRTGSPPGPRAPG